MLTGRTIGKRYARTDEIGVPFAVTVDSTTSVTIRERDSKDQVRVDVEKVATVIREVTEGQRTWEDVLKLSGVLTACASQPAASDSVSSAEFESFKNEMRAELASQKAQIQDQSAKIDLLMAEMASQKAQIQDQSAKIDILIKLVSNKGMFGAQDTIEIEFDKRLDKDKI
jgi:capsule polysaccharide export protein KpsE/RkpR